jgi:hypothetical protein
VLHVAMYFHVSRNMEVCSLCLLLRHRTRGTRGGGRCRRGAAFFGRSVCHRPATICKSRRQHNNTPDRPTCVPDAELSEPTANSTTASSREHHQAKTSIPAWQGRSRHAHNRRRRNARPRHHHCPCLQTAVRPFRTVPVRCLGMQRSWRQWSERARRHSAPWLCPTGPISSIRRRSWTDRS